MKRYAKVLAIGSVMQVFPCYMTVAKADAATEALDRVIVYGSAVGYDNSGLGNGASSYGGGGNTGAGAPEAEANSTATLAPNAEANFKGEATKLAKELVLPCPKPWEQDVAYIARATRYCTTNVKGAFPIASAFFPWIPPAACTLAGIQEKAAGVLAGAEVCKN